MKNVDRIFIIYDEKSFEYSIRGLLIFSVLILINLLLISHF